MGRSLSGSRILLLLGAFAAASAARAAEPDALDAIARRFDGVKAKLAREKPVGPRSGREAALEKKRLELARILDDEAAAFDAYAAEAPAASATVARDRATDARVEALELVSSSRSRDPGAVAQASSLEATLSREPGSRADRLAARVLLPAAVARGEAASFLEKRIKAQAPELLDRHLGHVVLLVIAGASTAGAASARSDDEERSALAKSLGLEIVRADGAERFGATHPSIELILDSAGHVRGVDLVGSERRSLVRELQETRERP